MQSFPDADDAFASQRAVSRPTRLALGLAVVTLLILLAVIGASAEHGTGAAQLRRGPASVVLSVLEVRRRVKMAILRRRQPA